MLDLSASRYLEPGYCRICDRARFLISVTAAHVPVVTKICKNCLAQETYEKLLSKHNTQSFCNFCEKDGNGIMFFGNYFCKNCVLEVYEYIANYLEK